MRGTINENIIDMLDLRPLDEVLKEKGVDMETSEEPEVEPEAEPEEIDEDMQSAVAALQDMSSKLSVIEGTDHADAMDELHKETLEHARDLMSYGFNIDHPRARGIFEIAASMYGHAISAKNSKRDAQLKALKLAMDRKRVELEEKRTNHAIGQTDTKIDSDGTILVEDRNELLRRMREKLG
jgi:hypothetical protein